MSTDPDHAAPRPPRPPSDGRSARRSPRPRARRAPSALAAALDLRLARDAQGQARPRAAARRDDHPGDVRRCMFTYLFGGAIAGSTGDYLDYILPGILVMSVLFTTVYSGVALNTDLTKGVVDRFRSLPIWRPAPLVGALLGDSVRYLVAGTVIIVLGVILGYRPGAGVAGVARGAGAGGRLRLRPVVGVHDARPPAALAERGHERGLHGDLPADLPEQRLRRARDAAERARGVRQRQPDLDPRHRLARADGGRRRPPATSRSCSRSPRR